MFVYIDVYHIALKGFLFSFFRSSEGRGRQPLGSDLFWWDLHTGTTES